MKTVAQIVLISFFLCFLGCQKGETSVFTITNDNVGKLDKFSLVSDLESIYEQDSLAIDSMVLNGSKKIRVFEKGGKHLLTLTPNSEDSPTIEHIRIHDPRFETEKGVSLESTFKDIKEEHDIKKVLTSMNNVLIILKDSRVYFTIGKEELPSSLRYASSANIEAVQIPDKAKIKYMMVAWD